MVLYTPILFTLFTIGSTISVIPGPGYLPAVVRASCRAALSQNIAGCSDELQMPVQYIPTSSLSEIYGGFCKEKLQNMTEEMLCSDCYLQKVQLEIDEPLDLIHDYTPEDFNSLKKSCGIPTSSYPVKPTTPAATPTLAPICKTKVTAKAGDTINSIAKSNSVATDRLLTWNANIPTSINETLTGGEIICFDNVSKCLIQQVAQGDTCKSLVAMSGKGVDIVMFRSWNPTVGYECRNLPSMVGKYICIGPPGQTGSFTPIEGTPKPTFTTTSTPEATYSWGTVPNDATKSVNITTSWIYPTEAIPIATNTAPPAPNDVISAIMARQSYCPFNDELGDDWEKGLADDEVHLHSWDLPEECMEAWDPYCIPDPKAPILPSPTTIGSTCYPTISTVIPDGGIKAPAPTNKGSPEDCNKWHIVQPGDNCGVVEAKYKITHASFRQMNPAINDACSNLITEMAYCVRIWVPQPEITETTSPSRSTQTSITSTVSRTSSASGPPGPTQSGTSPTCTKWHVDKQGDTCDSIAAQYGIVVSRFRQLNRGVDTTCSNLVVGSAYCVG